MEDHRANKVKRGAEAAPEETTATSATAETRTAKKTKATTRKAPRRPKGTAQTTATAQDTAVDRPTFRATPFVDQGGAAAAVAPSSPRLPSAAPSPFSDPFETSSPSVYSCDEADSNEGCAPPQASYDSNAVPARSLPVPIPTVVVDGPVSDEGMPTWNTAPAQAPPNPAMFMTTPGRYPPMPGMMSHAPQLPIPLQRGHTEPVSHYQ